MNGDLAAPGGTPPPNGLREPMGHVDGRLRRMYSLQRNLAYNEMTMGRNGSVISRAEKADLRTRYGYCRDCEGIPIQLYVIKKWIFSPIWEAREPRAVAGECAGGVCFVCYPHRNPHRKQVQTKRVSAGMAPQPTSCRARPSGVPSGMTEEPGQTSGGIDGSGHVENGRNRSVGSGDHGSGHIINNGSNSPTWVGVITAEVQSVGSGDSSRRGPPSLDDERPCDQSPSDSRQTSSGNGPNRSSRRSKKKFIGVYVPEVMMGIPPEGGGDNEDSETQGEQQHPMKGPEPVVREPSEGSFDVSAGQSSAGASQSSGSQPAPVPSSSASIDSGASPVLQRSSMSDREISNIVEEIDSLVRDIKVSGSMEFLADIVVASLREHVKVAPVQSHCLRVIWDLCEEDDAQMSSIMAAGVPADVVCSMKTHPNDALVQEKGCGVMWAMGINSSYRLSLICAGACKQIFSSLQYFIATENLVRTAVGAMRALSPETEARERLNATGAPKVVAEAMVVHRGSVSIQRDGCAFLSNCAVNMEKQYVNTVPQDELESVVQAMANHRFEASVMQGACFALKNYTHEGKNCRTLRKCKDIDELIRHASQFERAPSCIDDAANVLEKMQISRSEDESLEEYTCNSIRRIVDSQIDTLQAPWSVLDFMRNYDWSPRVSAFCVEMFQKIAEGPDGRIHNIFVDDLHQQILRYCLKFDENVEVSKAVCAFLKCVASHSRYKQYLIDARSCQVLFKSLVCGRNDEDLVLDALKSLQSLLSSRDCYDQCLDKMCLVTEAMAAHASNDTIQVLGTTLFSVLESPPCVRS